MRFVMQSSRRAGARILPFIFAVLGSLTPWAAFTLVVSLAACGGGGGGGGGSGSSEELAEDEDVTLGRPTHSQPIKIAPDGRLVWVVNPASDTVSVIRADTYARIATIPVGDEPQSITLRPRKKDARRKFPYDAYVANAAAGTVTLIRVKDGDPDHFDWTVDDGFYDHGALATGSEAWSVVTSPDGRRVFVANSGQDTITVIDAKSRKLVGNVDLRNSLCNAPDFGRRFQPRGLAVTLDNKKLYVTRFLSFTKPGGKQGADDGKEGLVCRLDIDTHSTSIADFRPAAAITLAHQKTGFRADTNGDGQEDADTFAYPNQLQTIVLRGDQGYLPNIAASPSGPLKFNVDTQAFVNVIDGVTGSTQRDASADKFLNLHLGAQDPEPDSLDPTKKKKKLFFANVWDMAFTSQSGAAAAYVVSAGSDLLVKVNVATDGKLAFTVDGDTTRYVDLHDPANPATSGASAGKNPQGVAITEDGKFAFVANFVSRNMSVVKLDEDKVVATVQTSDLPPPGTKDEEVLVGAEMFFSSRGHFDRPAGANASFSVDERLSQLGWQNCASCHFKGLTDGVVWTFNPGPRKSIPLNGTFNPHGTHAEQRVLNYSAQRLHVEDFEANIRNVSGPGPLATAVACDGGTNAAVPTSKNDPAHGLLLGVGDVNTPPCVIQDLGIPNNDRAQLTVTLPGPGRQPIPAMTALREWVRLAVRTPRGAKKADDVKEGRALFVQAGCARCHGGDQWTASIIPAGFPAQPPATELATEPPPFVGAPYLFNFLKDIGSYNLGVQGQSNSIPGFPDIGAVEKATGAVIAGTFNPAPDGLGLDANNDGKGNGFAVPSLLGIHLLPPYGHNGGCESLACVLGDVNHRTGKGTSPDVLGNEADREKLEAFLESIDADTEVVPGP